LIAAAIVIISYSAAIYATGGWSVFIDALRRHQAYLAQFDAWTSPTRPPLTHLIDDFFIRSYRAQLINILTTLLVAVALVRHRRPSLIALASFGPFCLAAWLMLDRFSASRFSVGYAPLFAMLAADALSALRPRARAIAGGVYIALMIVWTWPALRVVHTTISPPVAAAHWLRANAHHDLYVDPRMAAFADALLPSMTRRTLLWSAQPGDYLLSEGVGAITFRRTHGHLWKLARQRYFETSVSPARSPFDFGAGWYGQEFSADDTWRWMGARSATRILAPCRTLRFDFYAPDPNATITIRMRGVLDRFKPPASEFMKTYRSDAAPEVVIETDRVAHTAGDARELGLRLKGLECDAPL
jgi:drug/metabolite transporter superfamily protein YnfA